MSVGKPEEVTPHIVFPFGIVRSGTATLSVALEHGGLTS